MKVFEDLPQGNGKPVMFENIIGLHSLCDTILSSNLDLSQVTGQCTAALYGQR